MIFDIVNIEEELTKERSREEDPQKSLLKEIQNILYLSTSNDADVLHRLRQKSDSENKDLPQLDEQDRKKLYSISQVKKICIKYRLRFLDSAYFKSDFPYEAIACINQFEKKYNYKIAKFKIVAPENIFNLQDVNQDPLLFAQLSDGTYYLVHKWGCDMAWYRNIIHYPFRNVYSYFFSVLFLAALIAFAIPSGWINASSHMELIIRAWLCMHSLIGLFGFIIFIGTIFQKNFSESSWNSKYFNG